MGTGEGDKVEPGWKGDLVLRKTGGPFWIVKERLEFTSSDGLYRDTVEAGSLTDGASSRFFGGRLNLLPTQAQMTRAAALHDQTYRNGVIRIGRKTFYGERARKFADQYFAEGMLFENIGEKTARIGLRGLRLFGWVTWNRYRRQAREKGSG